MAKGALKWRNHMPSDFNIFVRKNRFGGLKIANIFNDVTPGVKSFIFHLLNIQRVYFRVMQTLKEHSRSDLWLQLFPSHGSGGFRAASCF